MRVLQTNKGKTQNSSPQV